MRGGGRNPGTGRNQEKEAIMPIITRREERAKEKATSEK